MSITNYSELQSAITRWIARDDMAANIPDWIMLFEQVANRRLRTLMMEATAHLTTSQGFATLPADYLAWRDVYLRAGSTNPTLEYMAPIVFYATYPTYPAGQGRSFTIQGQFLIVLPFDDTVQVNLDYFQEIPPLSLSSGTNWLLQEYPDVYLSGALFQGYQSMLDLQNMAMYKAHRDEILDEIQTLSNKSRGVGGMRLVGVPTP